MNTVQYVYRRLKASLVHALCFLGKFTPVAGFGEVPGNTGQYGLSAFISFINIMISISTIPVRIT